MGQPSQSKGTLRIVWKEFLGLAALLVLAAVIINAKYASTTPQLQITPNQPTQAGAVNIPGLASASYLPGLADQFSGLSEGQACTKWQQLPEAQKRGLAFVDAKAVPACAAPGYVAQAAAEHAARLHKGYRWDGHTEYFDLGTPPFSSYYDGQHYSCAYLTKLVKTNYVVEPMPKPKNPYVETRADQRAFDKWDQQEQGFEQIFGIYSGGGKFQKGCYPPGVVFGKHDSITFYPNTPVSSLAETPAPVFNTSSRCNICFRGPVYTVKKGDTLGKISTCYYGEQWDAYQIQYNNRLTRRDITRLQIGQKLHIPDVKHLGRCVKPFD